MSSSVDNLILFMVRWPEPGRVKTRLARSVGDAKACAIHRLLTEECFREAVAVRNANTVVCGTGAPCTAFEGWLRGAWGYWDQPEGDLGVRLETLFDRAFRCGANRVAAIGSDAPTLTSADIALAVERASDTSVSVVPAADGGYVLLATRFHIPSLFTGIPWGADGVLSATMEACRSSGMEMHLGATRRDVDTIEDWEIVSASCGLSLRPYSPIEVRLP